MADVFQLEDIHTGEEARALDSDDDAIEIDDVSNLFISFNFILLKASIHLQSRLTATAATTTTTTTWWWW